MYKRHYVYSGNDCEGSEILLPVESELSLPLLKFHCPGPWNDRLECRFLCPRSGPHSSPRGGHRHRRRPRWPPGAVAQGAQRPLSPRALTIFRVSLRNIAEASSIFTPLVVAWRLHLPRGRSGVGDFRANMVHTTSKREGWLTRPATDRAVWNHNLMGKVGR